MLADNGQSFILEIALASPNSKECVSQMKILRNKPRGSIIQDRVDYPFFPLIDVAATLVERHLYSHAFLKDICFQEC